MAVLNFALNKTATASVIVTNTEPSKAIDGSNSTFFSTGTQTAVQFWQVDLGSPVEINYIIMICLASTRAVESGELKIYTTNNADRTNSTLFGTTITNPTPTTVIDAPSKTIARYIWVEASRTSGSNIMSFFELQVIQNLAYKKPVIASSSSSSATVASRGVDGDAVTFFRSAATGSQWFFIDFGERKTLTRIEFFGYDQSFVSSLTLSLTDNADRTGGTVIGTTANPATTAAESVTIPANSSGRYLLIEKASTIGWYEVYVEGFDATANTTTTTSSTTTSSSTTQAPTTTTTTSSTTPPPNSQNLAFRKPLLASSQQTPSTPIGAIVNNTGGYYSSLITTSQQFIIIDLLNFYTITSIKITGVGGQLNRSSELNIYGTNYIDQSNLTLLGSTPTSMSTADVTVTVAATFAFKYILIRSERTSTTDQTISLIQVQVFGTLASAPSLLPPTTTTTTTTTTTRSPSSTPVADYINVSYGINAINLETIPYGGTPPYTYTWYRSKVSNMVLDATTLISGVTTNTLSDINVASDELYIYRVRTTDSNNNSVLSFESGAILSPTSYDVGFIGDSITAQNQTMQLFSGIVSNALKVPVRVKNMAVPGSRTSQWVSGQVNLNNAMSAFNTVPKVRWVMIMLGTNDSKNAPTTTQTDYKTNMQNIVDTLVAADYKVIINAPPSLAGIFTTENQNLENYVQTFKDLIDNKNVFMGSIKTYTVFSANKTLIPDSVHPSLMKGNELLQRIWADAFINIASIANPGNVLSINAANRTKQIGAIR